MNQEVLTAILSICGALITFDKVIDIVLKFKSRAEDTTVQLQTRMDNVETEIVKIKGFLATDKLRLDRNDKGVSILQRAILALIDNAIDNNNKEPLIKAKDALNDFLIDKGLDL